MPWVCCVALLCCLYGLRLLLSPTFLHLFKAISIPIGIALRAGTLNIDENGGSGNVCVVKISEAVPAEGLTVALDFVHGAGKPFAGRFIVVELAAIIILE